MDEATKESITTQVWFLNDQKDQIPDMTLEEQVQLYEMIQADSKDQEADMKRQREELAASKASAASPRSPSPAAATLTTETSPTSVATNPSQAESEKEESGSDYTSGLRGAIAAGASADDESATSVSEDEGESVYAMLASVAPPPKTATTPPEAPKSPSKSSLKDSSVEHEEKNVQMAPMTKSFSMGSTSLKHNRSDSFSNLDELDTLLIGGDIEPLQEDILAWSSETPHNLSDWTLLVEDELDASKTPYYVHKLVLSTGPTKSEHFERRFAEGGSGKNVTEVILSYSAAGAVPDMLDFLYSREDELSLTSTNALGLRHLGKLWGIRKLVVLATKFIRDETKPETSLHYLNSAAEFQDEVVMARAAEICAGNIMTVDREGLTGLDPALFSMVVSCQEVGCSSEELSKIVSEFCRLNEEYMNEELLHVVTASEKMPDIHRTEAVYLLSLSEQHETEDKKSDLESRCIASGSIAWNETLVAELEQKDRVPGPYDLLTAELKVKLLQDALLKAGEDFNALDGKHKEEMDGLSTQQEAARVAQQAEMEAMKSKVKKAMARRTELEDELHSFARVPWNFKAPKPKIGTYQPNVKGCGQKKPTAVPSTARSEDDLFGSLFVDGANAWPMYYFKK